MTPPKLDPAIVAALKLDPANTKVASHGGSGFSMTAKITAVVNGVEKDYFLKTGTGEGAAVMFAGEHASLNAIHDVVPTLCPASLANGTLADGSGSFLVTDFLDMSAISMKSKGSKDEKGSGQSLAAKLAKLHSTPAPAPAGHAQAKFGFPVPTCCGSTEQPNSYKDSWAEFYAENRLRAILRASQRSNGSDAELARMVEDTAAKVVPRLLGDDHLNGGRGVVPVVVHGDLWSGNKARGRIAGQGGVEEVVFDPSACYAHSEYELGIMQMFGGFGKAFWEEYHGLVPRTEPVGEYEDRLKLYELYHYLNHFALFGGGYRAQAVDLMSKLNRKYGG